MRTLFLILTAVCAYFLGGINGSIIVSRYIFHKDVRKYGSGNAGLTNFFRTFGPVGIVLVLLIDVLKSVIAISIGGALLGIVGQRMVGKVFAGFCLILGHSYPAFYQFKGGKGVLCGGVMAIMIDWRVGLCCWVAFIVVVIFTRYVSLGSMISSLLCPISMWIFSGTGDGFTGLECVLALLCALLIVFRHAENILRLIGGTENRLDFGKHSPTLREGEEEDEDDMY